MTLVKIGAEFIINDAKNSHFATRAGFIYDMFFRRAMPGEATAYVITFDDVIARNIKSLSVAERGRWTRRPPAGSVRPRLSFRLK